MFKVDGCGWAHVELGKYKNRMSYLTDVPSELVNKAIAFLENGSAQAIKLDGEGRSYTLVFDNDGVYVIKKTYKTRVTELNIDTMNLLIEIFKDVNGHIEEWVSGFYGPLLMTEKEEEEYTTYLKTRSMILFELLKERIGLQRTDYYWEE